MASRIWEIVEASQLRKGDVVSMLASFDPTRVSDDSFRARVTEVYERPAPESEPLPYVVIRAAGPTDRFEPLSGVTTGKIYRQGDKVKRMKPALAAMVSDSNLRTRLDRRPAHLAVTDIDMDRLEGRQLHLYRQFMGQDRDETRDAPKPIDEYVAIADVLAPIYRNHKHAEEVNA